MKKIILLFMFAFSMTTSTYSERQTLPMEIHEAGDSDFMTEKDRYPIQLPIVVFYDSETNIIEVWCDNDNIQAEVFVYDESGALEAYSPYMNMTLQLSSSTSHSILLKGDGWQAEAEF